MSIEGECYYCGRLGHTASRCFKKKRDETICYNCNGSGHVARECLKRRPDATPSRDASSSRDAPRQPQVPPPPRFLYKIKVTNIAEDTTRNEVFNAFIENDYEETVTNEKGDEIRVQRRGSKPVRVVVPLFRDGPNRGKGKGFAFVFFGNRHTAQKAIDYFNGYRGFDGMIWEMGTRVETVVDDKDNRFFKPRSPLPPRRKSIVIPCGR